MNVLSYSPKVEAYACVGKPPFTYLDLTPDIVSACVTRAQNGASSFNVRLQNMNGKYFDVFTPMDRVKVYVTKGERVPLIVGYITSTPKFSIYGTDLEISGLCPIYRLQQLYWDPQLYESQKLMGYNATTDNWDDVLVNLLTKVAGYDESQILLGKMPQAVIDWAREMYAMKADDTVQAKQMVDDFYNALQTHGPMFSAASTSVASSGATGNGYALLDGVDFSMAEDKFVKLWGDRINKFYDWYSGQAGKTVALSGHGEQFAKSAYYHKIDPRLSPSMSIIETGGGENTLRTDPYNAWGWGAPWGGYIQQSSWDAAIEKHISGLVESGYGDDTSIRDMVYRYAPPQDGNDTEGYIRSLTDYFEKITSF